MKKVLALCLLIVSFSFAANGLYRDPVKQIVVDTRTGLIWEDDQGVKTTSYTWVNALNFCSVTMNNNAFAGYTGWRAPNINELKSIIDYTKSTPAIDSTFVNTAPTTPAYYWSSTTYAQNTAYAWGVDFSSGVVSWYSNISSAANNRNVRCVK